MPASLAIESRKLNLTCSRGYLLYDSIQRLFVIKHAAQRADDERVDACSKSHEGEAEDLLHVTLGRDVSEAYRR